MSWGAQLQLPAPLVWGRAAPTAGNAMGQDLWDESAQVCRRGTKAPGFIYYIGLGVSPGAHLGSLGVPASLGVRGRCLPAHLSLHAFLWGEEKKNRGKGRLELQQEAWGCWRGSILPRQSPPKHITPLLTPCHPPPTFGSDVADLPGGPQDAGDTSRSHGAVWALLPRWTRGSWWSRGAHGTGSPQGSSLGAHGHLRQLLCRAERGRCGMGCGVGSCSRGVHAPGALCPPLTLQHLQHHVDDVLVPSIPALWAARGGMNHEGTSHQGQPCPAPPAQSTSLRPHPLPDPFFSPFSPHRGAPASC